MRVVEPQQCGGDHIEPCTFIGIDLAWRSNKNPTGLAVLRGQRSGSVVTHVVSGRYELAHILQFVIDRADGMVVVGIDAPLIITNRIGQRECETQLSRKYGDRHASCHTSNLSRYQDATSLRITEELVKAGFEHAPDASSRSEIGRAHV